MPRRTHLAAALLMLTATPAALAGGQEPDMADLAALAGRWIITATAEAPIPAGGVATMDIAEDGTVTGTSVCNSYGTTLKATGTGLIFGPARSTRMACGEAEMAAEHAILRGMERVDGARPEGALMLLVAGDATMLTLARAPD